MSEENTGNKLKLVPTDTKVATPEEKFFGLLHHIDPQSNLEKAYAASPHETQITDSLGDEIADVAEWITRLGIHLEKLFIEKEQKQPVLPITCLADIAKPLGFHVVAYQYPDMRLGYMINVFNPLLHDAPIWTAHTEQKSVNTVHIDRREVTVAEWEEITTPVATSNLFKEHVHKFLETTQSDVTRQTRIIMKPRGNPYPGGGRPTLQVA